MVLHYGSEYSKIKPHLYIWIFIGCDVFSIITQAAGRGLAAGGQENPINIGNDVMLAGICIQVATMFLCACLGIDFGLRVYRNRNEADKTMHETASSFSTGWKFFMSAMCLSFLTVFIWSVYRIPEMAGGWGSKLQHNETESLNLDGAMVAIAAICMTAAHPGIFFPEISSHYLGAHSLDMEMEEFLPSSSGTRPYRS